LVKRVVRRISVHVKRHYVKPTTYVRRGKVITRGGFWRGPYDYMRKDVGKPGKGRKVISLREGAMTRWAVRLGYIKKDERISDIPLSRIDDFALDLAEAVGPRRAYRMFHAQVVLRQNMRDKASVQFRRKMERARDAIADKYESELAPVEAISAWKSMSPRERARRMPNRKRGRR
jgi:hypothetical protein